MGIHMGLLSLLSLLKRLKPCFGMQRNKRTLFFCCDAYFAEAKITRICGDTRGDTFFSHGTLFSYENSYMEWQSPASNTTIAPQKGPHVRGDPFCEFRQGETGVPTPRSFRGF